MQKEKQLLYYGCGFNNIYPKDNKRLFYEIIENDGLVISEYDLDMPPLPHNFLRRNRIVAALSNGVLLIEAKENSGSLTTANYAKKLKRKLFVIPGGALDLNYKGSNKLLVDGAKCVLTYKDILKEYDNISFKLINEYCERTNEEIKKENEIIIPEEYKEIYISLSSFPKTINQISIELNIPINILASKLTLMEMEGLIECMPGKTFKKKCSGNCP